MSFWEWAVTHGATGILAAVTAGLAYAVVRQHKEMNKLQEERIGDMKAFTEASNALNDKVHKTIADVTKAIEFSTRRRMP
jgi:hypothetical protein